MLSRFTLLSELPPFCSPSIPVRLLRSSNGVAYHPVHLSQRLPHSQLLEPSLKQAHRQIRWLPVSRLLLSPHRFARQSLTPSFVVSENRMRLPLEIVDITRANWPKDKPLFIRISASDWYPEGEKDDRGEFISWGIEQSKVSLHRLPNLEIY
jgi:hypothetical protein